MSAELATSATTDTGLEFTHKMDFFYMLGLKRYRDEFQCSPFAHATPDFVPLRLYFDCGERWT